MQKLGSNSANVSAKVKTLMRNQRDNANTNNENSNRNDTNITISGRSSSNTSVSSKSTIKRNVELSDEVVWVSSFEDEVTVASHLVSALEDSTAAELAQISPISVQKTPIAGVEDVYVRELAELQLDQEERMCNFCPIC
jgi:hypothetical protein